MKKLYRMVFLTILPGACALAQSAKAPAAPNLQIALRSQSNVVMVPTLVKTKAGDRVFSLAPQDFTITDNGTEQKVTLDGDQGQQPLALVVVVQTGGAGVQRLPGLQHLQTMLEAMVGNVPHQVALVVFDSKPHLLQNFTPNLADVGKAMQAIHPGDGGAAILDGLAVSINMVRKQPPEFRRAVLLISGTVDHGSQTKLDEALRVVSETNTVIYSMAFSTTKTEVKAALANTPSSPSSRHAPQEQTNLAAKPSSPPPSGTNPAYSFAFSSLNAAVEAERANTPSSPASKGCSQHATQSAGGRLGNQDNCASFMPLIVFATRLSMNGLSRNTPRTVARLTGGEYKKFDNERELESGLFAFANDLPNRYLLSFQPVSPTPGLHTIQVTLKNYPKLQIAARTSYWAAGEKATRHIAP